MGVPNDVDIFLKLDGIKGESKDAKHPGEIDIFHYEVKATQEGTRHRGSGGGGGKAVFGDLMVISQIDTSTTDLFKCCAAGTHISNGTLTVRKAGGTALEFWIGTLTDIVVSSWHVSAPTSDERRHLVTFSLNFAKIKWKYYPQAASGAAGVATEAGWDVAANQVI
jgi:type VI secretion system secreted protein Hcp